MALAPLEIGSFRALWVAAMVSNLGSFLQTVAGSWLMLELTGSATWVGLMIGSNLLPLLLFALAAGAAADLFDRTHVMLFAQLVMGGAAAAMAIVTFLDRMTPGLLLGLGLLLGVGVAFNLPAWQAMVPDLVPRGMVASAVALNSVAFNVARAAGPALGGLVVATAGPAAAFALNALSFVGTVGVVLWLRATRGEPPPREQASMSTAVGLGLRFARFTPTFRRLLMLGSLFAITSATVQAVLPGRTTQLGGSAATYGVLLGAMGAGALVGAVTRGRVVDTLGSRSVPVTIAVFGVAGITIGVAPNVASALPGLALAGAAWVWTLTTMNATAQLMSPPWVRGRAMSLWTLAFTGIVPVGSAISGAIADLSSPGATMTMLSVGSIVLGLSAPRFRIPALGEVVSPEYVEERIRPDHPDTEGGPVMVVNTWELDRRDVDEFLTLMREIRLVRLRTGAYRWRMYRNADDPHRLSEVFVCVSWEEHLAQHRRIDDSSVALIRRARRLDRRGEPVSRHLVAVDVEQPAEWEALQAAHDTFHALDGSIPLERFE